ncbi:BssC/TutF protein [delta proteobacterium NaphS2]|nr:BssC/TutF protein [delta proteobacterium NaphS2]
MAECKECRFFFGVPENADDFKPGKGDCVTEIRNEKGKSWLSKPVFEDSESCGTFVKKV